jgi:hypothetical protein
VRKPSYKIPNDSNPEYNEISCTFPPNTPTPWSSILVQWLEKLRHLGALQHDRLPRMRQTLRPHLQLLPPLRPPIRHPDIVLENQSAQHLLNFIRRKKPTGTRVAAVPKRQVRFVGSHELVARVISRGAAFAELGVPETVEGGGGRVQRGVGVDGCRGDFEEDAGGDVLAVGEGEAFEDAAGEVG